MNLEKAVNLVYPDAIPNEDFVVVDEGRGAEIKNWNYHKPFPSQNELESAWKASQDAPEELTLAERLEALEKAVAELRR